MRLIRAPKRTNRMSDARGYIKLYRSLLDDSLWVGGTLEQKAVMITLLLMASHKQNEWIWQGQKFQVMPGQFITSLDGILKACGKGISIKNIRTVITNLEKHGFLANEPTKTGRLITIANWALYQSFDDDPAKLPAKTRQSTGKDPAAIKNNNNGKKQYMSDFFDQFWKIYPSKNSKAAALKSFNKLAPDPELFSQMMAAVEIQKAEKTRLKETGQFCPAWPNPSTWLNNRRWEDEATDDQEQPTYNDSMKWV